MAGLFSWLSRKEDVDYEKLLAQLDERIRSAELRIAELAIQERRARHAWLIYSLQIALIAAAAYALYFFSSAKSDKWPAFMIKSSPVVAVPLVIYLVRSIIGVWYKRIRSREEDRLEELKTKQKERIEELKRKTAYYMTKGLIERYEAPKRNRTGSNHAGTPKDKPVPGGPTKTKLQQHGQPQPTLPPFPQPNPAARHAPGQFGSPPSQQLQLNTLQVGSTGSTADTVTEHQQQQKHNQHVYGQQQQQNSQHVQPTTNPSHTMTQNNLTPSTRGWFDKILDAMIGETDGPQHKYALICEFCFKHNGLVLPHEYLQARFKCVECGGLNSKMSVTQRYDFHVRNVRDVGLSSPTGSRDMMTPSPPPPPTTRHHGSPSPDYRNRSVSIESDMSFDQVVDTSRSLMRDHMSHGENLIEPVHVSTHDGSDREYLRVSDIVTPEPDTALKSNVKRSDMDVDHDVDVGDDGVDQREKDTKMLRQRNQHGDTDTSTRNRNSNKSTKSSS